MSYKLITIGKTPGSILVFMSLHILKSSIHLYIKQNHSTINIKGYAQQYLNKMDEKIHIKRKEIWFTSLFQSIEKEVNIGVKIA